MRDLGRFLVIAGAVLIVIGLALPYASRIGLGRLPGDIVWRRGHFSFCFPLMTSILVSIVLTLLLWVFRR